MHGVSGASGGVSCRSGAVEFTAEQSGSNFDRISGLGPGAEKSVNMAGKNEAG